MPPPDIPETAVKNLGFSNLAQIWSRARCTAKMNSSRENRTSWPPATMAEDCGDCELSKTGSRPMKEVSSSVYTALQRAWCRTST